MDFLERLNLALLEFEEKQRTPCPWSSKHPFYFVIGAPRSGTTLLTQMLAYCYEFSYISNIAARFYMNPVVGVRLSKQLVKHPTPTFESRCAQTESGEDIHEFGWFWMTHLGLSSSIDVDWGAPDAAHIDLTLKALRALQSEFSSPIVMKGIYPAYYSEWLNTAMGEAIRWINIERDPIDTCISIWDARGKDKKKWFGWHIPKSERERYYDLDPTWQIAYQVSYFRRHYREIADVTIQLEDLCTRPYYTLQKLVFGETTTKRFLPEGALHFNTYDREERAFIADEFTQILGNSDV